MLQDHATDLAGLVARGRAVEERAGAGGLEVRDGRVELAWGVTGAADVQRDRAREESRVALQSELDLLLRPAPSAGATGCWRCSASRPQTLADVSHGLREG